MAERVDQNVSEYSGSFFFLVVQHFLRKQLNLFLFVALR